MKIWINMHIYDIFHGRIIQPIDNLWKTNEPTIKSKQHSWTKYCTKTHPLPQLLLQNFWIIIIGTFWRLTCSVDCILTPDVIKKNDGNVTKWFFTGRAQWKFRWLFFSDFLGTKVLIKMLNGRGGTGGCHPSLFSHKSIVQTPHFLFFFFLSFTTQSQTAKRWVSDRSRPQMERDTERKK